VMFTLSLLSNFGALWKCARSIISSALDLNVSVEVREEVTRPPRADLGMLSPRMSADEHGRPQKATVEEFERIVERRKP
jgi:hypothetical protein